MCCTHVALGSKPRKEHVQLFDGCTAELIDACAHVTRIRCAEVTEYAQIFSCWEKDAKPICAGQVPGLAEVQNVRQLQKRKSQGLVESEEGAEGEAVMCDDDHIQEEVSDDDHGSEGCSSECNTEVVSDDDHGSEEEEGAFLQSRAKGEDGPGCAKVPAAILNALESACTFD